MKRLWNSDNVEELPLELEDLPSSSSRGTQSLIPIVLMVLAGVALTSIERLPAPNGLMLALRLVSVLVGQCFWAAAVLLSFRLCNSYAERQLSGNGKTLVIFNAVKWAALTVFLVLDALILERAYEGYFIFRG